MEVSAVLPVGVKVPVAGSYNSAVLDAPVINTFPLSSRVAVWCWREAIMSPVTENLPVIGS